MDNKVKTPLWSKNAQKKMIDQDMSKLDLAKTLKVNYTQMISVLSGKTINPTMQERICTFLNIKM